MSNTYITQEYVDSIKDDCMFRESGIDKESGLMYVICIGPDGGEYQFFWQEDVDHYIK